jgi:uncharacterized lipoprotein NlpE involved in copper resistance
MVYPPPAGDFVVVGEDTNNGRWPRKDACSKSQNRAFSLLFMAHSLTSKIMISMKNTLLLSLVVFIGLISCKPKDAATAEEPTSQTADTTMASPPGYEKVSTELAGMYKGVLPCADCEGIETVIVINTDNTYLLRTNYLGKPDAAATEKTGIMRWSPEKKFIVLGGLENMPTLYAVGENKLTQLDMEGNPITGDLADKYILTKQ